MAELGSSLEFVVFTPCEWWRGEDGREEGCLEGSCCGEDELYFEWERDGEGEGKLTPESRNIVCNKVRASFDERARGGDDICLF